MPNLFRKAYTKGWYPSADAVGGPGDCLLRADNLILDEVGITSLRQGSALLYTLADIDIHSLFSVVLDGTIYRFAGATDKVYLDGADLGFTMAGSGSDVAFGSFMGQVFMARGTTKKKWDHTNGVQNWGIPGPSIKPTVTVLTGSSFSLMTCDSTESPALTVNEGTSTFIADSDAVANGAIQVTPTSAGRAVVTKIFAATTDLLNFTGQPGKENDVVDMKVALGKPEDVISLTVMFGLKGSSTDPFRDDYYYFDFNIGDQSTKTNTVVNKNLSGIAGKIGGASVDSTLDSGVGSDPLDLRRLLDRLDKPQEREGRSRERKDVIGASPAWFHLTVPRGQFNRVGSTNGKDWSTVLAVKVIAKVSKGSTGTVALDKVQMFGGGDRIWTGKYKARYRFCRNNGNYIEKSPFSPASDVQMFDSNAMRVTIPYAALQGLDPGVNETWIYIYGGFMDTYYRVAVTGTTGQASQQRMDVFPKTPDGTIDNLDRIRHIAFGFTNPGVVSTPDLTVDILTSEVDAIQQNFQAEPGCLVPPNNIVMMEGDWQKRLWALASDGFLYPSLERNPSTFNALHAIRIGDPASIPYWVKKTAGGLFIGTSEDIFRVSGSAGEFQDGTLDLNLESMNCGNPPVSSEVASEGNLLIYRSDDGWRTWSGSTSIAMATSAQFSREAVDLLWRGYTRHGVSPINKLGRFRACIQRGVVTIITPEGADSSSSATIHRYDMLRGHWYRHTYSTPMRSIMTDPSGRIFVGDTSGHVVELDTGTLDQGANIPVVMWTPVDDDGTPMRRKDPMDLWLKMDTGNAAGSVAIHLDNASAPALTVTPTCNGMAPWKQNIASLGVFRQAQLRITGSYPAFKLYESNLFYRARPQTHMAVDTGYLQPPGTSDLAWIRSVDILVNTPNNLEVLLYLDDTLYATKLITIGGDANKTKKQTVKFDREAKGTKPRVLVRTVNSPGATEIGFEPYWVRVLYWPTGGETEKPVTTVQFNEQMPQTVGAGA